MDNGWTEFPSIKRMTQGERSIFDCIHFKTIFTAGKTATGTSKPPSPPFKQIMDCFCWVGEDGKRWDVPPKKINHVLLSWHYANPYRLVMTQHPQAILHAFKPSISVTLSSTLESEFSLDKRPLIFIFSWNLNGFKTIKVKRENKPFIFRWNHAGKQSCRDFHHGVFQIWHLIWVYLTNVRAQKDYTSR